MNKIHTLLVVWQDKKSCLHYHLGTLSHYDGYYEFSYTTSHSGQRKLKDTLDNSCYIQHFQL